MATTNININGTVRPASQLDLSGVSRKFRDAWSLNGDVVEYDVNKMKVKAIQLVNEWAKEGITGEFVYEGNTFTLNEDFMQEIRDADLQIDPGSQPTVTVYADDDTEVVLTAQELKTFRVAVANNKHTVREQAKAHRDTIRAATTPAEITAVLTSIGK